MNINFSKKVPRPSGRENEKHTVLVKMKDITTYSPILENNPFGPPMKLIPITNEQKTEKLASVSELILIGTTVGPANLSYAIFDNKSHPDTPQEIFSTGENVDNYGTLTRIERDWVELTRGTATYRIYMVESQTKEIQVKTTGSSQTPFAKKINERQYMLDLQRVQNALKNPEQILTDARLLPNVQNGKIEGFKISEVKPEGLYGSLGLKNGDILLRINNLEISNPEVAIQAMSALGGMNSVNLDIIRDDVKMTMTYQMR